MEVTSRKFIDFFASEEGSIGVSAVALTGAVLATSVLGEVIEGVSAYANDWEFHADWSFDGGHGDWSFEISVPEA